MIRPDAAIEQLSRHQTQCDIDGVMVQVSRQALDEVLAYLAAAAEAASRLPPEKEIRALIDDFIVPDWDTKKAFASHRRAWIVQCLLAVLRGCHS